MKLFKKPETKKDVLKNILKFIIVVHLVAFTSVIAAQTAGRPNFCGKVFMVSATLINSFYIFPLSKLFGPNNPLTTPFYKTRDALYN